jgi:hypothetical protein
VATVAQAASPYTVTTANYLVLGSSSASADLVLNLPASSGSDNVYCAKKMDSNAHNVGVKPAGSDTIDGVNSQDNIAIQYQENCYVDGSSGAWSKI